jgi:hypothetical protein
MASLMLLNECKPVNTLVTDFEDLIHPTTDDTYVSIKKQWHLSSMLTRSLKRLRWISWNLRHPTHVAYPLFVFFTILKQRSSQKSANV